MLKSVVRVVVVTFLACLLIACHSKEVTGNGELKTQKREFKVIDSVNLQGTYSLKVVQADTQSVSITADSNILPLVVTELKDKTLWVMPKPGIRYTTKNAITITVKAKSINQVSSNGNNAMLIEGVKGDRFSLLMNGSGTTLLSGQADQFILMLTGSGTVNAQNFVAKKAQISLHGAGNTLVRVTDHLDAVISGVGVISYYGKPESISQTITGSGKLTYVPLKN